MENYNLSRLALPQVTLCAATSVNVAATVHALEVCLSQIDFSACKLFTDAPMKAVDPRITVVPISPLGSSAAYSDFLLSNMIDHVETSYCLVTQWDGHVLDAQRWRAEFLNYDYIGAIWPQFDDGHDVGNGGFSLRSRRLMEACRNPRFKRSHPEDIAIARINRPWLESCGLRFAPSAVAKQFATERTGDLETCFGYHGVWHMPKAIGLEAFWEIYRNLDNQSTIKHDVSAILNDVRKGRGGIARAARILLDQLK
tara:strand:+ start:9029 stop:9793 length:765 start_codon:yes stop_codon:yes gene_type:complete